MLKRSLRLVHGFSALAVLFACTVQAPAASAQPPFPFCFVAIQFTSYTVPASGGALEIRVLVEPPFCGGWTTSVSEPWINITSGQTGSFDGTIRVSIPANTGATRTGVLTVFGRSNSVPITITQNGVGGDQPVTADFDGDGRTDLGFFRPATGEWFLRNSRTGEISIAVWGGFVGDRATPADYDGDGRADLAFFREADGYWYILGSRDGPRYEFWPAGGAAVLTPADYDGDRRSDVAFFQPSDGFWYILPTATRIPRYEAWGGAGDQPAAADFDGDGSVDVAFFRPGDAYWYILPSRSRIPMYRLWGGSLADRPAPADYDGDGIADVAFQRPGDGYWYVWPTREGIAYIDWRVPAGASIARGDFDGDGRADVGFFSPGDNFWYLLVNRAQTPVYVPGTWRF